MGNEKKELDTEVDMISFISLLSVLICALLLSAVWVQIGTMDVKQAVGGQSQAETKKLPVVWVLMKGKGSLSFSLKDSPKRVASKISRARIKGLPDGKVDLEKVKTHIQKLTESVPGLTTALIKPNGETDYGEIISLMDQFKSSGLIDLGVSPL